MGVLAVGCALRLCARNWAALKMFSASKKLHFSTKPELECIAPLFQTVAETPEAVPTKITGTIPQWINGSLLRNGPGRFEFGNDTYNHWFDGMALMHRFKIHDGSVTYLSKFLQSDSYKQNKSANRIVISEFGTLAMPDPCKSVFNRFMSKFQLELQIEITQYRDLMVPFEVSNYLDLSSEGVNGSTDNCSVNFVRYNGDYYVSTETNFMRKVDPEELNTLEKVDWSQFIAVNGATAHPHYDPDGTAYNMGNSYGKQGTRYNIIKVPAQRSGSEETLEGAQVVCSIEPQDKMKPSYYHSFGMTENYVVFIEQPLKLNIMKILTSQLRGKPFADCMRWEPKHNTVFHVINKHTGKAHTTHFSAAPLMSFHHINAYEDQGCIVLDVCCQDDGMAFDLFQLQNLRKSGQALEEVFKQFSPAFPRRYVLPLVTAPGSTQNVENNPLNYSSATAAQLADGKVWCTHENLYDQALDSCGLDFPQINYFKYNTKKYRFFYGCGFQKLVGNSLIKVDVETKKAKIWKETGFYPSEPIFVPSPQSAEEDDGVILSAVLTPHQDKSTFLLVLDAKDFTEIGRAEVPVHIPYGFHGIFVPQRS